MRVLREVGQLLVDVNGQHAALTLKDGTTRVGVSMPFVQAGWLLCRKNGLRMLLGSAAAASCRLPNRPAASPMPPSLPQLRLLDRLAGTTAAADAFAITLADWQAAAAQLWELDALSDEQQREAMQRLVDEVREGGDHWSVDGSCGCFAIIRLNQKGCL